MKTEELLNVIRTRRSVRVYKGGKVSDRQLETILEAARWAPSGANTQPWEFVVTRDRKKMKRRAANDAHCGKHEAWDRRGLRAGGSRAGVERVI